MGVLTVKMLKRITIVKVRKKDPSMNVNQDLQWLGNSLGLFNLRDKDSSCFRVFITLVRTAKRHEPLSSDNIAGRLNLSRGTVVHHLTKLMDAGVVVREKEGYLLRENNLKEIISDMKRDMEAMFKQLEIVAKDIDEQLG